MRRQTRELASTAPQTKPISSSAIWQLYKSLGLSTSDIGLTQFATKLAQLAALTPPRPV